MKSEFNNAISVTRDYSKFILSKKTNRDVNCAKHAKLYDSMQRYGFIAAFPLVCMRHGEKLVVKDGQHRLTFAMELGLPVYWIMSACDYDVAQVASSGVPWSIEDHLRLAAKEGDADCAKVLEFASRHGIAPASAAALLANVATTMQTNDLIKRREYKIKDELGAARVLALYADLVAIGAGANGARLLSACFAACQVSGFDPRRLVTGAKRQREKLIAYATVKAYLVMLEHIYNYGQANKNNVPLAHNAGIALASKRGRKKHMNT